MIYPVEKTESGKTVIGIGGGAYKNTFTFRTVMKRTGDRYTVKPALFIRKAGDRACKLDQGITEIEPGDLIVTGSGYLPISDDNPECKITAYQITEIAYHKGYAEVIEVAIPDIPDQVIAGAQIYHNREGLYFAGGIVS